MHRCPSSGIGGKEKRKQALRECERNLYNSSCIICKGMCISRVKQRSTLHVRPCKDATAATKNESTDRGLFSDRNVFKTSLMRMRVHACTIEKIVPFLLYLCATSNKLMVNETWSKTKRCPTESVINHPQRLAAMFYKEKHLGARKTKNKTSTYFCCCIIIALPLL